MALLSLLVACGGDDEGDGDTAGRDNAGADIGSVDVLGIWGGEELTKFEAVVQPWEQKNGGQVNFTGTRDISAVLTARVEGGNPPDIATPAEIGLFRRFASEGKLVPLSDCDLEATIRDKYPESFIDLATVDGELYGFFVKADTKGTVWYNPKTFEDNGVEPLDASSSFDDLVQLSRDLQAAGITPWSIGLEAGGASGWPGSDWIQQIILNEGGEELYDGLVNGSIPFTDPRVKEAWQMFGAFATDSQMVLGGPSGVNATNFQNSAYPPFESPPRAAMVFLGGFAAGFIADQFPNLKPGDDYDFFPFPGGKVTGGANIVYAFNSEEGTCSLMRHLASADAQEIWVKQGGFTSVNEDVEMSAYPNEIARKQAEQLLNADTFKFDLDDAIGAPFQDAEFTAITQFVAAPDRLDSLLASLAALQGRR